MNTNQRTLTRSARWILAALVAAVLLPAGLAAARHVSAPSPTPEVVQQPPKRPKLPREWVWTKKTVDFDGMYRTRVK